MNNLFLDIECCNSHNICEFGYVLTDEKFNIIKQEQIIINPAKKFTVPTEENKFINLTYDQEVYFSNPSFKDYYEKIKEVINAPNQMIFGYAINNDAIYLKNACKRYKLKSISFTFYDIQAIVSNYFELKEPLSLKNALEKLDISTDAIFHRAMDDAISTMKLTQKLIKILKLDSEGLIKKYYCCKWKSNNNYIFNCEKEKEKNSKFEQNKLREELNQGRLNYSIGDLLDKNKK